jgi:hypothetical protein
MELLFVLTRHEGCFRQQKQRALLQALADS